MENATWKVTQRNATVIQDLSMMEMRYVGQEVSTFFKKII